VKGEEMNEAEREKKFEDYLINVHAKQYVGTDDNMPDAFDDWLSNLDCQEIIEYTQEWNDACRLASIVSEVEIEKIVDKYSEAVELDWKHAPFNGVTILKIRSKDVAHALAEYVNGGRT
jgi:hypothetical protein